MDDDQKNSNNPVPEEKQLTDLEDAAQNPEEAQKEETTENTLQESSQSDEQLSQTLEENTETESQEAVKTEAEEANKDEEKNQAPQEEQASQNTPENPKEEVKIEQTQELPQKPKNPNAKWYVVHTYSGHESKVAATLKQRVESQKLTDKIFDILVPTQEKIEIKEGKKNTVKEKIFPGYLLVSMVLDDYTWLAVRTTPGITGFIGTSNKPTPLPEQEVETIKKFMRMEAPKFRAAFSVGEAVKITDGPFSEFLGSISEIDEERGKLKVMVSIFGRETPVELDFLQVAKL